jgi:5-methylcytosine-specific restriction protein A
MKRYLCRGVGCGVLLESPGYCAYHKIVRASRPAPAERKPFEGAVRSNQGFYNSARWRRLRREAIKAQPYCVYCGVSRKDAGAPLEIHHIIPPRGDESVFFDPANIEVVCHLCHANITQREIDSRRRRRTV